MTNISDRLAAQEALIKAVMYALKCGCFFPVRMPEGKRLTTKNLVKWGAMRNLHNAIAALSRSDNDSN